MEPLPETNPIVVRDVFPAQVVTPSGVARTARVVLTQSYVYVWTMVDGRRTLALCEPYEPGSSTLAARGAPRNVASHLTLAGQEAPTVHIQRERGCGCNNPLKAWRPWTPYRVGPA